MEEAFDGDGSALEGAFEDDGAVGSEAYVFMVSISKIKGKMWERNGGDSPRTESETTNEGTTGTG